MENCSGLPWTEHCKEEKILGRDDEGKQKEIRLKATGKQAALVQMPMSYFNSPLKDVSTVLYLHNNIVQDSICCAQRETLICVQETNSVNQITLMTLSA